MDTNITKTWTIEIKEQEIFDRCTNESLYQAYSRTADNPKGDAVVMQEDDKVMFKVYFDAAIAGLSMILARRMAEPTVDSGMTVSFVLQMHDNHDNNILPILTNHCYEYVTRKVLEQWYRADLGSELERLEINHCLHYRKNPVRRRIGPLF
jgi:hypothetical protein